MSRENLILSSGEAQAKKWAGYLLVLALLVLPGIGAPAALGTPSVDADTELIMGIFPRRNAEATRNLFTPMAEYLSKKLGRRVRLESTHDFRSFWDNVAGQRYDIVHFNQYHYVRSRKAYGYRVILKNEEFGHSTIASTLLVRKDSGIDSIADLRGRKIIFGGGKKAMQSYITARYLLQQGGLAEGDYFSAFAINPPKACIGIYYRQAAAAGTGSTVPYLPNVQNEIDISELKVLKKSAPMAQLPWAVKADMSDAIAMQIQTILSELKNDREGKKVLESARLTNLVIATDDEYNPHRQIIRTVLDEEY